MSAEDRRPEWVLVVIVCGWLCVFFFFLVFQVSNSASQRLLVFGPVLEFGEVSTPPTPFRLPLYSFLVCVGTLPGFSLHAEGAIELFIFVAAATVRVLTFKQPRKFSTVDLTIKDTNQAHKRFHLG